MISVSIGQFISLDVFTIFHLDCIANTDWKAKLLVVTLVPIGFVGLALLLQLIYAVATKKDFKLNGYPIQVLIIMI